MQIKSEIDVTLYPHGKSQEMSVSEGVKRPEVWCAVEMQNGTAAMETPRCFLKDFKATLLYNLSITLLCICW